ncbi:unnamed protein product [Parnassius apollo]|uniref:(apollo) hypothetical protein n=1 Tax=Parnassius apollo TaxID=110799 RepID=A0A8S3XG48_PARAO|nr:unnamed protein product [Parnassius apollo]
MSRYRASKEYKMTWSTLKVNVDRVIEERKQGITHIKMLKVGRPFSLSANLEQSLLSYIIQMQELGFDAIAPAKLSDQPVITGQESMEEITIGIDYDDEIPHSGIYNDPLCDGGVKENNEPSILSTSLFEKNEPSILSTSLFFGNNEPSILSTSLFEKSQTQNDEPLVLQMECELEPITNTEQNILTTDDVSRSLNKHKITIHDILILPKWKPNT